MSAESSPSTIRETELKMRVDSTFQLPELVGQVACVAATQEQPVRTLTAVYYDTDDLRLLRWGVTLRRREGGDDAGWHLKLPVSDGVRDEVRLPLTAGASGRVPQPLAELVTALHRGAALKPVATLRTQRRPTLLLDDESQPFAELVDDTVAILDGVRFRELEVEALRSDVADHLHAVAACLIDHGAVPGSLPKVATALGSRVHAPPDVPVLRRPRPKDPAGDAVRAHLATHVQRFMQEDIRVRRNLPDAVHQMRVAARRLRSGLKVFAPLVDSEWASRLRKELSWAADGLGEMRDTEVLLHRLTDHAASLPSEQADLASGAVDKQLRARMADAQAQATARLNSRRHRELLVALVAAVEDPHLTERARERCRDVLPPLVEHSWRALVKDAKHLHSDSPAVEWHQTRIAAKRTRYAAEAVAPILGKRTKAFAHAVAQVTDVLGDQHDAMVCQRALADLASTPDVDGATGYALGLLSAREDADDVRLRGEFRSLWPDTLKAHRRVNRK